MSKIRRDPADLPFAVVRGEWWEDRKAELAELAEPQLEAALTALSIPLPERIDPFNLPNYTWNRMLWLRLRLAYAEQNVFAVERGQPPTSLDTIAKMDSTPGFIPHAMVNIFYGAGER